MLGIFELQFDFVGNWHIGVSVNSVFQKYIHNQHLVLEFDYDIDNVVQLTFLGKEYSNPAHTDNVCKINAVYVNQLLLSDLINHSIFITDNREYSRINGCNYINLNGTWQLTLTPYTVQTQLKKILNV